MDKRTLGVLSAGFLTTLTAYAIRYGYGIILPEMLLTLAISKTEAGVIFASYFITYTLFAPVLGLLSDRYNARVFLSSFVATLGLGTLLMSYSSSTLNASLFFTIAGIGSSACWAPVMALIGRSVSDRRRGMALAFSDGSAYGIIFSGTAIPLIVVAYDWKMGWMSLGGLAFLVAVINLLLVRDPVNKSGIQKINVARHTQEPIRTIYSRLLRDTKFWLIAIAYMMVSFSILIPFTFLTTYAVHELSLPYKTAGMLITIIGVMGIAGKLSLGTLSDKVGRIRVMMLCSVLIAAGSLGMAYSQSLLTLMPFTIIFGIGYGAVWPIYAAAASDYFSKETSGSIIGLWSLYVGIGSIVSPVVAGRLGDSTGTLSWSFILGMASAAISLFLLIPIYMGLWRPTKRT